MFSICRHAFAVAVLGCLAPAGPILAADVSGNFAFKGAGAQSCAGFRASWQGSSKDLLLYGGWLDGYVTAFNQSRPETFDVAPWQSTQTLLGLAKSVCDQMPDETPFALAAWKLLQALVPDRLDTASTAVVLTEGDRQTAIYAALIPRIRARLALEGNELGDLRDREFPDRLRAALRDFQGLHGLDASGALDQRTLFTLLSTPD